MPSLVHHTIVRHTSLYSQSKQWRQLTMAFREVHAVVRLHCVLYHTIKGTILRRFGPKTIFGMNFYEFFSVALISASAILIYANLCLCNSCLYQLSKLQKEFFFFLNSKRYRTMQQDSFSEHPDPPMLQSLQWLPTEQRMEYKLSLLCFKVIFHQAPIYLSELLHLYTPSWQLRSSADTRVFRIPSFRTKSSGQRSFSYQAPPVWNQLHVYVRHSTSVSSFKSFKPFSS